MLVEAFEVQEVTIFHLELKIGNDKSATIAPCLHQQSLHHQQHHDEKDHQGLQLLLGIQGEKVLLK